MTNVNYRIPSKIRECHVKNETMLCPYVKEEDKGKVLGMASDFMIKHYQELGVDTLQLMPIFKSEGSHWCYDTLDYMEIDPRFGTLEDFRKMVKKLQLNGIRVILDIAFNHTHNSRPIKEIKYYDFDISGCGNSISVKESLPYLLKVMNFWLYDVGVAGFRFDLANNLGREGGDFNPEAEFFKATYEMSKDKIFVAEPWDCAEYSLGRFPDTWLELDGQFRDRVLSGSAGKPHRGVGKKGVKYVFCHDNFSLYDHCAYNEKHNEANGEGNRDGSSTQWSWNFGVEGATKDKEILEKRALHRYWLNKQIDEAVEQGYTVMVRAGDEMLHTCGGNNNPWNQDNETSWTSWSKYPEFFKRKKEEEMKVKTKSVVWTGRNKNEVQLFLGKSYIGFHKASLKITIQTNSGRVNVEKGEKIYLTASGSFTK